MLKLADKSYKAAVIILFMDTKENVLVIKNKKESQKRKENN